MSKREPDYISDDGTVTLYRGDCLEIMPGLSDGSVDAVVTDPPYGVKFASHGQLFKDSTPIAGDDNLSLAEAVRSWATMRDMACCMFYSPYKPLVGWRNVLVWQKGAHVGIGGDRETCWKRDFEMIGIENNKPLTGQRDSAVLRFNALSPPPSGHFAEKPVDLIGHLIEKIDANAIIDPFMGSGTTGVACVKLGRRFIGIELDADYFDIAVRRIENAIAERDAELPLEFAK